ncbi:MAG: hypothetical protein E7Z84_03700 [Methanosphaera stadtmanae]|nr:hypothetical protein [Methanosphaera stadtmanae]
MDSTFKKGNEYSFRDIYGKFIHILDMDLANSYVNTTNSGNDSTSNDEILNSVFVYCYVDHTVGLSFLMLTLGVYEDNRTKYFDRVDYDNRVVISKDIFNNVNARILSEGSSIIDEYETYAKEHAKMYSNEELDRLRDIELIDQFRNNDYPDDIIVYFSKDDLKLEAMWVRLEREGKPYMIGQLLNEPDQDFGCNVGDTLRVYLIKTDDDELITLADLDNVNKDIWE